MIRWVPYGGSLCALLACGLCLALALPVGLAAPSKTTGNLLANGSFEEGPEEVGDFKSLDKGAIRHPRLAGDPWADRPDRHLLDLGRW